MFSSLRTELKPKAFAVTTQRGDLQQGRKSLRLWWIGMLRSWWFDLIAEASELPDHSCSACLLRLFGDGWAPFFVTDSLAQDQPDQPTLSMSNRSEGLIVSQAWDAAAIHNLEDASFGPGCGVGRLVENAPHVAVCTLRGLVAGRERRACCGYLNQGRRLSALPQGNETTPNYSLNHARFGSDNLTASTYPLLYRPRHSGPLRSYL